MPKKKKIAYEYDKSITTYFEEISKYSTLSKDEELSLWRRYKKNNDLGARDKLISSNLKFVANVAKGYQGLGLPYSDLIAEGNVGLLKAMEKFDGERGYKVISYSVWWINQSILEALKKRNKIASEELPKDYEKQPQEDEIYAPNSIPNSNDLFIDDSVDIFREGEISDTVKFLMKHLSEREKHIVTEYYGLNGKKPKTLSEIGLGIGLTKERVRQINDKALKKLRFEAMNNSITMDIYK